MWRKRWRLCHDLRLHRHHRITVPKLSAWGSLYPSKMFYCFIQTFRVTTCNTAFWTCRLNMPYLLLLSLSNTSLKKRWSEAMEWSWQCNLFLLQRIELQTLQKYSFKYIHHSNWGWIVSWGAVNFFPQSTPE